MKDASSSNPIDLFDDINQLHEEIKGLESKCKALEEKMKVYEGLPANLHDATNCFAEMKERIKDKELFLEKSIFMNL
jgi:chromosome segregation ATPase